MYRCFGDEKTYKIARKDFKVSSAPGQKWNCPGIWLINKN